MSNAVSLSFTIPHKNQLPISHGKQTVPFTSTTFLIYSGLLHERINFTTQLFIECIIERLNLYF